jgi:hypothetical protein
MFVLCPADAGIIGQYKEERFFLLEMGSQVVLPEIAYISHNTTGIRPVFQSLPYFPTEKQSGMVIMRQRYYVLVSPDGGRSHWAKIPHLEDRGMIQIIEAADNCNR